MRKITKYNINDEKEGLELLHRMPTYHNLKRASYSTNSIVCSEALDKLNLLRGNPSAAQRTTCAYHDEFRISDLLDSYKSKGLNKIIKIEYENILLELYYSVHDDDCVSLFIIPIIAELAMSQYTPMKIELGKLQGDLDKSFSVYTTKELSDDNRYGAISMDITCDKNLLVNYYVDCELGYLDVYAGNINISYCNNKYLACTTLTSSKFLFSRHDALASEYGVRQVMFDFGKLEFEISEGIDVSSIYDKKTNMKLLEVSSESNGYREREAV